MQIKMNKNIAYAQITFVVHLSLIDTICCEKTDQLGRISVFFRHFDKLSPSV